MKSLEVDDLTTRYTTTKGDVHALEKASFSLDEGESLGVAGESACGKSTLGLSLIRMVQGGKILSGKVVLNGESVLDLSESEFNENFRWKKIAMIFQGAMNSLDPVYTINQQFVEVLKQHKYDGDFDSTIKDAITSVNLDESVLKKFPHELSGGMKQRIVIAMGLLLKPNLVIADEPTTALDVLIQAQIVNLLKKLKKDGMSIVLITHDLAILSEISDKIGIMYGGKMIEFGSSQDIYKKPQHPYTQGLLKSIPTLHGEKPSFIKGTPPDLRNPGEGCRFYDRCPEAMEKMQKRASKN